MLLGLLAVQHKAVEWYTKAAEQGYANSQNFLAVCFADGEGVEEDKHEDR